MNCDDCIYKIEKHLKSFNTQPFIVDVQNSDDLDRILTHFDVGDNVILNAAKFCKDDELPRIESLLEKIAVDNSNIFLWGLTSFLRLFGEAELNNVLHTIMDTSISGHVILLTYQCKMLMDFTDPRLVQRILICEGKAVSFPKLVFISNKLSFTINKKVIKGIDKITENIEKNNFSELYIITSKTKESFTKALYNITEVNKAFDIVAGKDKQLALLNEEIASEEEWQYLLGLFKENDSFAKICNKEFGNYQCLETVMSNYPTYSEHKKWLYFIALKIFGTKNNEYLASVIKTIDNKSKLIRGIYRHILSFNFNEDSFQKKYIERKQLISALGNPIDEVVDYCKFVMQKGISAIYYLTDNTRQEKELILSLIEKYYQNVNKGALEKILYRVYPDLCNYLKDYEYEIPLLDKYFSLYTQSKVINKVLPELEELVNDQAIKREYNLLLEPRAVKLDKIDKENSQVYFMDAMGVEYLAFILSKCREKKLLAQISICTANLPSITSKNKEFIEEFQNRGIVVNSEKRLDEIKHHGTDDYDYQQRKQPFHIVKELEIIDEVLDKIKLKLAQGIYEKAIMISDHGASRLAVIHDTENMWEMQSKGLHSGRCCPRTDVDVKTPYATEENGFWVLANYDRFKGGRKANVEVHGGATLEEVVVPIIEITKLCEDIEIVLLEKIITVSYRKKAQIRLFSKTKIENIRIKVENQFYPAQEVDNNIYLVEMPNLKKAKHYKLDVFASNYPIVSGLDFEIRKESSQENDLL